MEKPQVKPLTWGFSVRATLESRQSGHCLSVHRNAWVGVLVSVMRAMIQPSGLALF